MMLFIDLGETYKILVGSRTSSLDLVTDVNFMLVQKTLDASMNIYKDCTPDHK